MAKKYEVASVCERQVKATLVLKALEISLISI